jgi:hypothetical protein
MDLRERQPQGNQSVSEKQKPLVRREIQNFSVSPPTMRLGGRSTSSSSYTD